MPLVIQDEPVSNTSVDQASWSCNLLLTADYLLHSTYYLRHLLLAIDQAFEELLPWRKFSLRLTQAEHAATSARACSVL